MDLPEAFPINYDVWMVPCRVVKNKKIFKPMKKPLEEPKLQDVFKLRNTWKPQEDETLKLLVFLHGDKNWSRVAKELNATVHGTFPIRIGKQCRERWYNVLDPSLSKTKWLEFEDKVILEKQREIGNKWIEISKFLPGRNENQIKNRWKSLTKKADKGKIKLNQDESLAVPKQITEKNSGKDSSYSLDDLENSLSNDHSFNSGCFELKDSLIKEFADQIVSADYFSGKNDWDSEVQNNFMWKWSVDEISESSWGVESSECIDTIKQHEL